MIASEAFIAKNSAHIKICGLNRYVRKIVPTRGPSGKMVPIIEELKPKYSPLLLAGDILDIVTERNGLQRHSPTVSIAVFPASNTKFPVDANPRKENA